MAKNNHGKTIILPLAKMHCWANHGKSSAEIAELIGITPDEMFDRLSSLSQKNHKSAKSIRCKLEKNGCTHNTVIPKQTSQEEPAPASIALEEIDYPENKAEDSEVSQLQKAIASCEEQLRAIAQEQQEASRTIIDSKKKVQAHEVSLKALLDTLARLKSECESEKEAIIQAEQTVFRCEKEQAQINLKISKLQAKLQALMKPVVLVYADGIETENAEIPEDIDSSGWASLIDALPKDIGDEISKKEALLLLKIKAIMSNSPDADIVFDDGLELVQLAYEAMS